MSNKLGTLGLVPPLTAVLISPVELPLTSLVGYAIEICRAGKITREQL